VQFVVFCRFWDGVRELAGNHGARVNGIQLWCGCKDGDSWCCCLMTLWLDLFFHCKSPVPRSGSCEDTRQFMRTKGWRVATPQEGDVYFYINAAGLAHHTGVVTAASPLTGIAGNTTEDGVGVNGDGCYEHALTVPLSQMEFYRVPGTA
jgi:hypothetical protein